MGKPSIRTSLLAMALAAATMALPLFGCAPNSTPSANSAGSSSAAAQAPVLAECAVIRDTNFGGVYLDATIDELNELGFAFGDSVDIAFSNGYELRGIPYYNGYYVRVGDPLLVGYPGYPHVEAAVNYGDTLWDTAGLAEGKDRTGFVCALLEALCGATYDEIAADYMTTFKNYYGITRADDPDKYDAIVHLNLDGMLSFLAGVDDGADLGAIDYAQPAREYLKAGGMTDEQIDALVARLS